MQDPRIDKLARLLIDHSTQLKSGETVLIEAFDLPEPNLVCRLVELAAERGAHPLVSLKNNTVLRSIYRSGTEAGMKLIGEIEKERMLRCSAYIGIRGSANTNELSDVTAEQLDLSQRLWWQPVHIQTRVPKTRWVVLRYPTPSMAQLAKMSTAAFEEFYFDVCTADYAEMARRQEPLRELMLATDKVRIVGPGTDLSFSIKDIPVIPCNGRRNIPDGEVFTAPVKTSLNGTIAYNTGSQYQGTVFEGIRFDFKEGKIVHAECRNDTPRLNQILDSDEGARYIGEWSLGCNNRVRKPMLDTLFDEKIGGSMHSPPAMPTRPPTTATAAASTGISSSSRRRNTAEARSGSTES